MATIGLVLGYECNIRCRHCLWGDTLENPMRMTTEDARRYVDESTELGNIWLVGFTGGEAFMFKKVMQETMLYAARTYGLPSCIGSNSSFATSKAKALKILGQYRGIGLRRLQLSVDDYHQEWVALERVKNAVEAARELEIKSTLVCIVSEKTRKAKDYLRDMGVEEGPFVEMAEAPCTPVGFAAERIDPGDFKRWDGVPSDWCSMLRVLNVLPDGSVQMCCGAPFTKDVFRAGNAKREKLVDIVRRAESDPLFTALSAGFGVRHLIPILESAGYGHLIKYGQYASSCDACHDLLGDPKVVKILRKELEKRADELFVECFLTRDLPIQLAAEMTAPEGSTLEQQTPVAFNYTVQ
jgi:hypothetical protein